MGALESLALELSSVDNLRPIGERLAALAAEFDQEVVEHALVISKDDEWHSIMLSACPNRRLLDVIASVRGAFHRYESLLVPNDVMVERVAAEHGEIAQHLAKGDVPGAIVALKSNWMNGMRRILENASSPYFSA
jgi:DNA-binding GntR family transcriptional regulator